MRENAKNIIVKEKKISIISLLLDQVRSPLIYILIFAGIITFLLEEYTDAIIIFIAVILNTILGFYQEYKAEDTLRQLKKLVMPKAVLLNNGKREIIDATEVNLGDIVELSLEHQIPADGEIIKSTDLSINEAILTGEAMPVSKHTGDGVYAGTTIISGIGVMKVTSIGTDTRVGKITENVAGLAETKTPLQLQLANLARILSIVILVCATLVFLLGLFYGYDLEELFVTSVAVAVASIPEGLVITLTVILAIGMQRISKQKAIMRRLLATETLGSVTTICVDKTGTVTEGNLSVVAEEFIDKEEGYLSILLSNNHIDPLEITMDGWLNNVEDSSLSDLKNRIKNYSKQDSIPFNSKHKYTATLIDNDKDQVIYVFGAPEIILEKSSLKEISIWEDKIKSYAMKGKRIIGFGFKYLDKRKEKLEHSDIYDLKWNGLLIFDDPIRKDIKNVFESCNRAGIHIKMITGDYLETAKYIAYEIGLLNKNSSEESVITGVELEELSDDELNNRIDKIILFARTDPFQKLRIVESLKRKGEIVAMTGDGVNDSPALKAADIGVVVNEASDVSKETADMILLDSNFKTIVHAVEEGRAIFDNIKKVIMYLLSDSFSELILIVGAIVLKLPLPITAVQILWINLIEDSLPALSLAFEPKERDVLNQPPRAKNAHILDKKMITMILSFVVFTGGVLFGIFYILNEQIDDLQLLRTIIFAGLGVNSLLYIFACKSLRHGILSYNPFNNKSMVIGVVIGFIALFVGIYVPFFNTLLDTKAIPFEYWPMLISLGLMNLFGIEIVKKFAGRV